MHTSFWKDILIVVSFFAVLVGLINFGLWLNELFPVAMTIFGFALVATLFALAYSLWLDEKGRR